MADGWSANLVGVTEGGGRGEQELEERRASSPLQLFLGGAGLEESGWSGLGAGGTRVKAGRKLKHSSAALGVS